MVPSLRMGDRFQKEANIEPEGAEKKVFISALSSNITNSNDV